MKAAQTSTASFAARHMHLFEDIRDAVPRARTVLSIGCASGFEALDLARVFPEARILGCDISEKALAEARRLCAPAGIAIFPSSAETIRAHAPYDVITCLSVLVRYPEIQDQADISAIYPFADFDESLSLIVECLAPGGVVAVFNSCYLVGQATAAAALTALPAGRHTANGWIEKYDRAGHRLTRTRGEIAGAFLGLADWRRALLAGRGLADPGCAQDLAEHRLRYVHEPLTAQPVDLVTTLWRRTGG